MPKKISIKGKHVNLRLLSVADAATFCVWLKNTDLTRFLTIYDQSPPTLREEREWIKKNRLKKDTARFAIETIDGELIGVISLMKISQIHKHAEYGVFIGPEKYWGQGLGTEAGLLLLDYGFKKLKLHRVYLRHIAFNIRGARSYEKIGFKTEGVLREQIYRDGYWHDSVMMGILADEFYKKNTKVLQKLYG